MHKFTKKIVDMMKGERLFESQGGPIILSQVIKLWNFNLSINHWVAFKLAFLINKLHDDLSVLYFIW